MIPLTDMRAIWGRKPAGPTIRWPPKVSAAMNSRAKTTATSRHSVRLRLRRRRSTMFSASTTLSDLLQINAGDVPGPDDRSLAARLFLGFRVGLGLGRSLALSGLALALGLLCRLFVILILRLAQGGAKDVAKRGTTVGRAILGDRLFLLGHFERLDRHADLAGLGVDLGDKGIELLADAETFRPLLGAVAGKVGAADEGGEVVVEQLNLEPVVLDGEDLAGHPH